MEANINMLFVGDFYQHTFDTSRDGATNSTLFNSKAKYESRFTAKGFICDNTSLVNSWRCSKMFVNSIPHWRFTQSLGWPLSTYEILDFTLEKYGHELSVNGSTPYLFSVEPDGTAMRL